MCVTAASGGSSLFDQFRTFAIPKPKSRKTDMARQWHQKSVEGPEAGTRLFTQYRPFAILKP
jgi:hypothetical protein